MSRPWKDLAGIEPGDKIQVRVGDEIVERRLEDGPYNGHVLWITTVDDKARIHSAEWNEKLQDWIESD